MYSWIFRHRHRLGVVYGIPVDPPAPHPSVPQLAAVPTAEAGGEPLPETSDAVETGPEAPLGRTPSGVVVRRARYVLMAPMPRRALPL